MRGLLKVSVVVAIGAAVCGSVAYGGWTLWTNIHADRPANAAPIVEATPKPAPVNIDPVAVEPQSPIITPASDPTPEPEATASVEPVKPAETRKELPKGRKHDPQAALLANMAQIMHAEAYNRFISQPGQGMSRMLPTLSVLAREWKMPQWTSEELTKQQPPIAGAKDLSLIHRLSVKGFGSEFKSETDRLRAMAKEANAKEMKKQNLWEIKSLDLVGLVVHETPVVYVSEKLPDMKDLKNRPKRELDVFESEGLEELMSGKELYIRQKEGTIRVLGPLRAAKTCMKCHNDAKEGDMLGAFSYTLRPGRYVVNYGGIQPGKGLEINSATPVSGDPFGGNTPPRFRLTPKK